MRRCSVRTSSGSWYMRRETQEIANIEARIARYTGIPVQHGEGLQVGPTCLGAPPRGRELLACIDASSSLTLTLTFAVAYFIPARCLGLGARRS
jgi:hypothetical protein